MSILEAELARNRGNWLFREGRFNEAVDMFDTSIWISPEVAVAYANKSAALMKLDQFQAAAEACTACLHLIPK